MEKWEYMLIYVTRSLGGDVYIANGKKLGFRTHLEVLNAMGLEGWELVSAIINKEKSLIPETELQFCLKRRLP